jgi:hypothetical protein
VSRSPQLRRAMEPAEREAEEAAGREGSPLGVSGTYASRG